MRFIFILILVINFTIFGHIHTQKMHAYAIRVQSYKKYFKFPNILQRKIAVCSQK